MSNSLIWFWSGFTIVAIVAVMAWFIWKMAQLSKTKATPLHFEDE